MRAETARLRRGKGCAQCRLTGFQGRVAIFEMMNVTPAVSQLIYRGEDHGVLLAAARREGMRTLRESGVEKVSRGITTISEVLRVTMRDEE
jgi:type II secretory ATPase GspE/PulE/Tfp pilus assembly ATPase PilB-like protein